MNAPVLALPPLMTQTTAFLLLDDAHGNLLAALSERMDCIDCKGSGSGWCNLCGWRYLASEDTGRALGQLRACKSDRLAREIVSSVMGRLADAKRFGDSYEVAFGVLAGGAR
jgi:hypothetical protein